MTQTLPHGNTEHGKRRRFRWTTCFLLFWEGSKLVRGTVQVIVVHINEKWFFSLVIRTHNKCVPELGCSPVWS